MANTLVEFCRKARCAGNGYSWKPNWIPRWQDAFYILRGLFFNSPISIATSEGGIGITQAYQ